MDLIKSFADIPFLTITPLTVVGIVVGGYLPHDVLWWSVPILLVLLIVTYLYPRYLLYPLLVVFGVALCYFESLDNLPTYRQSNITTTVINKLSRTNYKSRLVEVDGQRSSRYLILIEPLNQPLYLNSGDTIRATVNIAELRSSALVGAKDYIEQGVDHFVRIYPESTSVVDGVVQDSSASWQMIVRDKFARRLEPISDNKNLLSLLRSMIVGDKSDLDPAIKEEYRRSGVSHYLAISGWHIAVLFMFLNSFLFWMDRFYYGRFIKSTIIVAIMWCFAALIGFTPSVSRAVLMFTLFQYALIGIISRPLKYNVILGSAFLFLCFNPSLLYDIGFQLSYMAVLSIHLFYLRVRKLIYSRFKLVDWFAKVTSLLLSVQILILPILLYYFGFYSFASLVPNIIFSLLLPVVIFGAMLFAGSQWELVAYVVNFTYDILDRVVCYFAGLDGWFVTDYYIDGIDVLIYYIYIIIAIKIFDGDY